MLKKLLLTASFASSLLYGNYYTSLDSTLDSPKTLKFDDKLTLTITEDSLKIKTPQNLSWIELDSEKEMHYGKMKITAENGKVVKYNVYNFTYLLKNDLLDRTFLLKIPKGFLVVETKVKTKSFHSKLRNKKINVHEFEYEVQRAFDKKNREMDVEESDILTKYLDAKENLVAIEILDDGLKKLQKSSTPKLAKFFEEAKKRPRVVKNADFSKEKLSLTYVSKKASTQQRMFVTYEMKKKNIKTVLKTPNSLFDPEYKGSSSAEHVGLMRATKKALYEMKKVEINDGSIDLTWINSPKKRVVIVSYLNAGQKDKKVLSKSRGQQFYAIEGVLYLATWMNKHNIDKRVFTFMNGALPFDVTMIKTADNTYEMQKKSNTIYKFTLSDKNLVKTIEYPAYDVKIKLEQVENETTIANKKFLKSFMHKNHIKLIKE
jgi:hypothetical protein